LRQKRTDEGTKKSKRHRHKARRDREEREGGRKGGRFACSLAKEETSLHEHLVRRSELHLHQLNTNISAQLVGTPVTLARHRRNVSAAGSLAAGSGVSVRMMEIEGKRIMEGKTWTDKQKNTIAIK
jgi:hypothetical protein